VRDTSLDDLNPINGSRLSAAAEEPSSKVLLPTHRHARTAIAMLVPPSISRICITNMHRLSRICILTSELA
jgi:hypothetical protein